ncbi:hypothetical protein [Campylobacter geochelonis]|nr:hypothetical protein [Campylobacter geochelonis]
MKNASITPKKLFKIYVVFVFYTQDYDYHECKGVNLVINKES